MPHCTCTAAYLDGRTLGQSPYIDPTVDPFPPWIYEPVNLGHFNCAGEYVRPEPPADEPFILEAK